MVVEYKNKNIIMVEIKKQLQLTYWIARSVDYNIIHYGILDIGLELASGQDELEIFFNEQTWLDRLVVMSIVYNSSQDEMLYWINYNNENSEYGELEPEQSKKINYLFTETFRLESEYQDKLYELGIEV